MEKSGRAKAHADTLTLLVLAILAGAFISLGALLFTVVVTGSDQGFGPTRLLGGASFCLGLILVVIAGAELFTGNNLIIMAWADRKIGSGALMRNWGLVYLGNFVGAIIAVFLFDYSESLTLGGGAVEETAIAITRGKLALDFDVAVVRGILCNILVCLAVWLCAASHRVSGKILAILFPISAFVALGFEHSVANMYLVPIGMLADSGQINWPDLFANLLPVTIGNVIGGAMVAVVYWVIYLRGKGESF